MRNNPPIIGLVCRYSAQHNAICSRHRREDTMANLLTLIVIVFLLCHSTKLVTHTYEAYQVAAQCKTKKYC